MYDRGGQLAMTQLPLQYNISSWDQLTKCQSNNSKDLHICVTDFMQNNKLDGLLIKVHHKLLGVLFACLVDGSGTLLSEDSTNHFHEFTTSEILAELAKFGFNVTYNPREHLDGDQLQYLMTLNQLGFDKIRTLVVHRYTSTGHTKPTPTVVAFKVDKCSKWIDNSFTESESDFLLALGDGNAVNISAISTEKKFRWDWLDYVANINDIIQDNA